MNSNAKQNIVELEVLCLLLWCYLGMLLYKIYVFAS